MSFGGLEVRPRWRDLTRSSSSLLLVSHKMAVRVEEVGSGKDEGEVHEGVFAASIILLRLAGRGRVGDGNVQARGEEVRGPSWACGCMIAWGIDMCDILRLARFVLGEVGLSWLTSPGLERPNTQILEREEVGCLM